MRKDKRMQTYRAPIKRAGHTKQNIRTICTCTSVVTLECDRRNDRPADCVNTVQDPELALRRYFKPDKCPTAKGSPYKNPKTEPRGKEKAEYRVKEKPTRLEPKNILAILRQLLLVAAIGPKKISTRLTYLHQGFTAPLSPSLWKRMTCIM